MEKIDRLRIGKDYIDDCPFNFDAILRHQANKINIIWKDKPNKIFYKMQFRLYREDYNNDKFSEQPFLAIDVLKFENVIKIRIQNSLRKWYFGKNSTRDFNKNTLFDCLSYLAYLLSVDIEDILCFKIYEIELGVTFRVPSEYKLLLANLSEHKEFKRYGQFNNHSSVYFNAKDIGIICYDVLQKLLDKNQISKNVYNKISNKFFFMRLELKIKKRSGVEFINEKMQTLSDLLLNKEQIVKYWISKMDKIQVNEDISLELANSLKNLSPKDIIAFFANAKREDLTWSKLNVLLDIIIKENPKKYAVKKSFRKLQEKLSYAKTTSNKEIFKQIILSVK